jgi:hypothetical protein
MASRSAGRYRHDDGHRNGNNNNRNDTEHHSTHHNRNFNRPNNRRHLHRGNNRNVLQRTYRTEYQRLRNERCNRVEQCVQPERRVRSGQPVGVKQRGKRWQQCSVHSTLFGISVGQRVVQLTP